MVSQKNASSGIEDFAKALAVFQEIDWHRRGREDANGLSDSELADCGYSNPQGIGTPWSDATPPEGRELGEFEDLTADEEAAREAAINSAMGAYNGGFIAEEAEAIERIADERRAKLEIADELGWRICQFGLPGASIHVVRVAAPGDANAVSAEIFKPGPCGPYDSCIFLPSKCAGDTYQDGTLIYGEEIDEILAEIDSL